jgi:hypothetical protein
MADASPVLQRRRDRMASLDLGATAFALSDLTLLDQEEHYADQYEIISSIAKESFNEVS